MLIFFLLYSLVTIIGLVGFIYFMFDSVIRSHDLPTSPEAVAAIVKIIKKYQKQNGVIYDAGCGRGTLVCGLKKQLPHVRIHGIDMSRFRLIMATIKSRIRGLDIAFHQNNIFNVDFTDADVVYTYLWYDTMPPFEQKLERELQPGAIVITNTSHFARWPIIETIAIHPNKPDFEKLFIYQK